MPPSAPPVIPDSPTPEALLSVPRDPVLSVNAPQHPLAPIPSAASQTPVAPQHVGKTLAQIVQHGGDGPVELTLRPEELGRIKFELVTTGDKLHVTLFVERPEAMDLMRRHGDQLLNDLRQSGFSQSTLDFGAWSQRNPPSEPAAAPDAPTPDGDALIAPVPILPHQPGAVASGRLHLRL
ncbi:MAG: flagellar hook-length control protein FliK [Cypionkella sp.]|nr:flagellar hook-length control protein FliK [Cypionkella sp.]